jgi:hypothetical protein
MGRTPWVLPVFCLVGVCLPSGEGPAAADVEPIAIVTAVAGGATLERATTRERRPLGFRDTVMAGDRIVTTDQSRVRLLLVPKIVVTIGERADVRIMGTSATSIELRQGMMAVAVGREGVETGRSLEVRTPNLTAVQGPGVSLVEARQAPEGPSVSELNVVSSRFISISGTSQVAPSAPRTEDVLIAMRPLTSVLRNGADALSVPTALTLGDAEEIVAGLRMRLMPATMPANELVAERNRQAAGAAAAPVAEAADRSANGTDRTVGRLLSGDDVRHRQAPRVGDVPRGVPGGAFGGGAVGGVFISGGGIITGIPPFQIRGR